MQFDVRDVARLLRVNENKIYHWINEENLPARQINGKYAFDRAELLEWATLKRLDISAEAFKIGNGHTDESSLVDALELGGIFYDLPGADRATALRAVVAAMKLPEGFDRNSLFDLFMSRESLGSSGVGDGFAIPHPRHPVILSVPRPSVSLCFLAQPVDFGAADKKPVHTMFVLISPTIRSHLQMLARIARVMHEASFRELLVRKGSRGEILRVTSGIEQMLDSGTMVEHSEAVARR